MIDDAHTYESSPGLTPGVWPQPADNVRNHFQLVGGGKRALVVMDLGGVVQVGGIDVTDPAHLEEFAVRLGRLANKLHRRQVAAHQTGAPQ